MSKKRVITPDEAWNTIHGAFEAVKHIGNRAYENANERMSGNTPTPRGYQGASAGQAKQRAVRGVSYPEPYEPKITQPPRTHAKASGSGGAKLEKGQKDEKKPKSYIQLPKKSERQKTSGQPKSYIQLPKKSEKQKTSSQPKSYIKLEKKKDSYIKLPSKSEKKRGG